jgi:hypothetical protein
VLRSNGIPQRTIAVNIGCDLGTLHKHFRVELKLLDRASPSIRPSAKPQAAQLDGAGFTVAYASRLS